MGKIRVGRKVVFGLAKPQDEPRTPEEEGVEYSPTGSLAKPDLVDKELEESKERESFSERYGEVRITVSPGEELGQVSINVQFEGKRGETEFCLRTQGELSTAVSDWLGEFLRGLGPDFEVDIEAKPCPAAKGRLPMRTAAVMLERGARVVAEEEARRERERTAARQNLNRRSVGRRAGR